MAHDLSKDKMQLPTPKKSGRNDLSSKRSNPKGNEMKEENAESSCCHSHDTSELKSDEDLKDYALAKALWKWLWKIEKLQIHIL